MDSYVTVATASIELPEFEAYPSPCLDECRSAAWLAAKMGAEFLLLPETPDFVRCPSSHHDILAEPIPGGATCSRMQEMAREMKLYLAYSQREREGDNVYNTGLIISPEGKIVGKYRKMHLAPDEGLTPGNLGYPVFELPFGKVAMGICMDIHFPEMWRIFALSGANLLLWPTMANDYTGTFLTTLITARAIDNQAYFMSSHYVDTPYYMGHAMGCSRIVGLYGRVIASTSHRAGIAMSRVDINAEFPTWYAGEYKTRYPNLQDVFFECRRPETYGKLVE